MTDRRRAQWFAFDAYFLDGDLGIKIRERFGSDGLVLFVGFLAACKRAPIQGRLSYASDAEALLLMGLPGLRMVNDDGDEWSLETFWTFLGQQKQTRRTARGRMKNVIATRWGRWQKDYGTATEAERKRRSRATNTPDVAPPIQDESPDDSPPLPPLDKDIDRDQDKDKTLASASPDAEVYELLPDIPRTRKADELWDTMLEVTCTEADSVTESGRGAINKALKDLRAVGATADELRYRAAVYRMKFPDAPVTAPALAKQWAGCAQVPTSGRGLTPAQRTQAQRGIFQ